MKEKERLVDIFLRENHISLDCYNFEEDLKLYIAEMQKGLDSESTIPMLPTYIEVGGSLPPGKTVLVLDAGGTNFRAAIVSFNRENEPEISKFRKRGMPGFERIHSREEFFDAIADFIGELTEGIDRIGFCFSYPMVKTSDKDGRLIGFSKEIKAPEVEGQLIGEGVIDALEKRGIKHIKKIVLLNDTVATLLAGRAAGKDDEFDEYVGLIYGTGVNASYNELNSKIGKVKDLPPQGSQLINMEAGSCGILASGPADERYRMTTANADAYKFEKMVSGGYLGSLWFSVLQSAADAGCFSDRFADALQQEADSGRGAGFNAADLSAFLADRVLPGGLGKQAGDSDVENALAIGIAVAERAAYLTSVMIAGILTKTGRGLDESKPVSLCIDGTTFWKLHGQRERVVKTIDNYFRRAGIYYRIIQIENAPIIGAAVAGLTNN